MIKIIVPFLIFMTCHFTFGSVLGDLAKALPARTWVEMPENNSLKNMSLDYSIFYYNDSGCWDPLNKRMRWVGGPGTCCANPAIYQILTYDEASDTWSRQSTPYSGSGHGYDGNALDPGTGDHYFTRYHDEIVHKYSGSSWSNLPTLPYSATAAMGLAWFPELNNGQGGLVHVGGSGRSAWFNGSSWTAIPRPSQGWGSYHTFAEYNPVHKFVWLGGGNNNERVTYKLDAQLNLTRFQDAPFNLRPNVSVNSVDPISGKFIVRQNSDNSFWEFDPIADSWQEITGMANKPASLSGFNAPITDHGVIMYLRHQNATRRVYLYRHTAGTSVVTTSNRVFMPQIRLSPNPFRSSVDVRFQADMPVGALVQIFDVHGKLVHHLFADAKTLSAGFCWNASRMPGGVYVLRVNASQEVLSRKLLLSK
jgi:hypothetical protein